MSFQNNSNTGQAQSKSKTLLSQYNNKIQDSKPRRNNNDDINQQNSFDRQERGGDQNSRKKKNRHDDKDEHDTRNQTFGMDPRLFLDKKKLNFLNQEQIQSNNDSLNNTGSLQQQPSLSNSFHNFNQPHIINNVEMHDQATLDSNGNVIRGRKIDSPQLLIVRELTELEDQEDLKDFGEQQQQFMLMMMQDYGSGSGGTQEIPVGLWNSKDRTRGNSSENRQNRKQKQQKQEVQQKRSKSQETKQRIAKGLFQIQKAKLIKREQDKVHQKHQFQQTQQHLKNKVGDIKGIKSSRDVIHSINFNELLNQLDKDVSIQQSNQIDFKNRTTHDDLKLELSGIKRQNNPNGVNQKGYKNNHDQQNKKQMDKRSRSREKKSEPHANKIGKKKGMKDQIFQYVASNIQTEVTPDKCIDVTNTASFLQSEHGRCMTSQGNHQAQQNQFQNSRTKSQSNIIQQTSHQLNPSKVSKGSSILLSSQFQKMGREQSSDDKTSKDIKAIGSIDKLVRDNIKKMRSREDEEKMLKQIIDDKDKKKKEQIEAKNNVVRLLNKEKIYRKSNIVQVSLAQQQQSQDPMQGEVFACPKNLQIISGKEKEWQEKFKLINNGIMKKERFLQQKQSQSQKIDFNAIKEQVKNKRLKNHRKSYGLEFLDIKKEIQEELKTIELKFQRNDDTSKLFTHKLQSANNTDQSIKRIKLKSSSGKYDTKFDDDQQKIPATKIVFVKKSKIRKFMKAKKKELIIQQWQEKKNEIIKTVKMQENIMRLNDFCKKKIGKNLFKKRNVTIHLTTHLTDTPNKQNDPTNLSGRKLQFENFKNNMQNSQVMQNVNLKKNDDNQDDSSRLSTEFYEEYFRLLNSIKKEQNAGSQDHASKLVGGAQYSDIIDSSSQNITQVHKNSGVFKSPQGTIKKAHHSPILNNVMVVSPKQLSMNSKSSLGQNKQSKKSKSKGLLQHFDNALKGNSLHKISGQRQTNKVDIEQKNYRAESAPLLLKQPSSHKKKGKLQKDQPKKPVQEFESLDQDQQLEYILLQIVKIQRAYKQYLYEKGFYYNNNQQDYISNDDFQTQVYNEEMAISQQNVATQQRNEDTSNNYKNKISSHEYGIEGSDFENDDDDDLEEDDNEDDESLIIINQQDERKVVYMSNINSCSLPQTPKIDDKRPSSTNNDSVMNKVFDYKPGVLLEQDQFFYQSSVMGDQIHQSISNKPSIQTINSDINEEKKTLVESKAQKNLKNIESQEEVKLADYGMRLFTGSESLLREFKLNTPKHQSISKSKEHLSDLASSHHSQSSLRQNLFHQQSNLDSKKSQEQTSQSSQSLFDRNSFQQFTMQKLTQIMKNNEYMNLISMREKALQYRQEKEIKFIKKMYKNSQYSPRTYKSKKESLEKWVKLEKEEIQKTKKAFQEEWQKTVQIIEDTQKNVDKMREKMKISIDNNKIPQQIYNSHSSRGSSSSYVGSTKHEKQQKHIKSLQELELQQEQNINTIKSDIHLEEGKDLIEFLETSWQKNQKNNVKEEKRIVSLSKQGIYIEDQNDIIQSSQISEDEAEQILSGLPDLQYNNQKKKHGIDDRPLMRSRSEQDLSELIKKSKLSDYPDAKEIDDNIRVQENEIISLTNEKLDKNQLNIQENMFEDSSNRFSKGKDYYQDINDAQSNDSILNDSQMNNFFQDQKFSLQDFKSLDKRKILDSNEEDEEADYELMYRHNSHVHIDSNVEDDRRKLITTESEQELSREINPAQKEVQDFQSKLLIDDQKKKKQNQEELNDSGFYNNPDIGNTAFLQHQQALLFSNSKPGENIKISDILKKTQIRSVVESLNSMLLDTSNSSQLMFQNQQINNSMIVSAEPTLLQHDYSKLTDKITDEIMSSLLSQNILIIPKRQEPIDQQQPQTVSLRNIPNQHDNSDVFMIENQFNEKEQRRETIEFRQRMIIEGDLQKIENYINEIIACLQQSELQNLALILNNMTKVPEPYPDYHRMFLQVLTTPIKRNELELLNQLQTSEIGSYDHFETVLEPQAYPILPVDLYLEIERLREEMQINMMNNDPSIELESSILQESIHIQNKAIFDALNESLMKFRPYGIQGEPMPWSNKNRRLQTKVDTNSVDTERLFMMVKQDVLRWVQTFSGCQPTSIFIFRKPAFQQQNQIEQEQFDDDLFQETRERRLAQMLAAEVIETEHHWLNYEFEEAQVKIDLSDMILEHLVEEAVLFLNLKNGNKI